MADFGDADIEALISDVIQASKIPAKRRGTSIKPTVDQLAVAIYDEGLEPRLLNEVVDLVTLPSHLDQASLNVLVNNLFPASTVPSDVVLKIAGCLGRGELKPSFSVQSGLLRWLVMVYHILDNAGVLSQAYSVLFNLLETVAVRPQLCHLLALITRRKHVRPFRIQAVLNLSRQTGNDPALMGLLRIYKDYYPEIIVGEAVRGKASAFKHPDLQWRERLDVIQRDYARRGELANTRSQNGFSAKRGMFRRGRGTRPSGVPTVYTSHATENSVTLEEIDSADRFIQNLEKIELPNQLAAVLADSLLQKLIHLRRDDATSRRISYWVEDLLSDLLAGNADVRTLNDTMDLLEEYVSGIKETPPAALNFLVKLFETWNGVDARDAILGVLSHTPLTNFEELQRLLFRPLEKCLPGNAETQISLLRLYSRLMRHWSTTLKSLDGDFPETSLQSMRALERHVGNVSLNLVQASPSLRTHAAVLEFYEQAASTMADPALEPGLRIATPPPQLVYLIFFSPSLGNVSRLTGVLADFKTAFDAAMARNRSAYGASDLRPFNGFLMDLCNCLWRGRALNAGDTNALGCMASRAAKARLERYVENLGEGLVLPRLFELSHSPVLSLLSITSVRRLEDEAEAQDDRAIRTRHAGPVTQSSLQKLVATRGLQLTWPEYRLQVLRELDDRGLAGIPALMRNVMKVLQHASVSSQASRASSLMV